MAKKHMKRGLIPLVIREMQTKTTKSYLLEWLKNDHTKCGEHVEELTLSYTASGNAN